MDFVTSSYAMLLSAIAQATKRIRLTSTLSVISTADPVRVFEDFATLDLISGGRTEAEETFPVGVTPATIIY